MKSNRSIHLARCIALASAFAVFPTTSLFAQENKTVAGLSADQAREENAYTLGVQAYLWGWPLAHHSHSTAAAIKVGGLYLNDYRKYTELKAAKDRFVVTPNNVTIDAYCAFDVSQEPLAVFVPKLGVPRWYLVQIGDDFDEIIHNVGGIKGEQSGVYVITGPGFSGEIPGEMTQIRSRTNWGVVATRILANGAADLPKAVEVQKGFQVMPLSAYLKYGLAYQRPSERPLVPDYQSQAPTDIRYFDDLGYQMGVELVTASDAADPLIAAFSQIGLSVGKGFEWQKLDEATRRGLARAIKTGEQIVDSKWATTGEMTNGWKYTMAGGRAGYDFGLRAALCKYETGAQVADQVIYPNTAVDDKGERLIGTRKYVLHFDAGKLPPVAVFWNMAMYASDMFFVENDFGRYSIGSTTDGLKKNSDGSLDILIQKGRPADTANWLPAPAGEFNLTLRFYGPETPVLDGSYRLPAVKRVP